MGIESCWKDPEFAKDYALRTNDPKDNWYEQQINSPSIIKLIPLDTRRILDFGCGSGEFTAVLAERYDSVEGCDNSQAMVDIARRNHPIVTFSLWDFRSQELPPDHIPFDTVVSKLTVQFIRELDLFAAAMRKALRPSGALIISVPHPSYNAGLVVDYWQESNYHPPVSLYGVYDTMVHRSLERYTTAFMEHNFVLNGLTEPKVDREMIEANGANPHEFSLPKRLNLRFRKEDT
ncbi:MAG TPA: class I SAM-dependent methyltransferase [Candidatus Saccharimonadales bacterium]|nr:class I SAM-dependent methyltransferase [Candidatus Saccharimonadales bacterium]